MNTTREQYETAWRLTRLCKSLTHARSVLPEVESILLHGNIPFEIRIRAEISYTNRDRTSGPYAKIWARHMQRSEAGQRTAREVFGR